MLQRCRINVVLEQFIIYICMYKRAGKELLVRFPVIKYLFYYNLQKIREICLIFIQLNLLRQLALVF